MPRPKCETPFAHSDNSNEACCVTANNNGKGGLHFGLSDKE